MRGLCHTYLADLARGDRQSQCPHTLGAHSDVFQHGLLSSQQKTDMSRLQISQDEQSPASCARMYKTTVGNLNDGKLR